VLSDAHKPKTPKERGKRGCIRVWWFDISGIGSGFWGTVNDLVLEFGYNPVCTQLFWFFRCREIQNQNYLLADMRVKCYEGAWERTRPYAVLGFIVFMFGIPLSQLLYMCCNRKYLHPHGRSSQKVDKNHKRVKRRLGSLYLQYTNKFWWINILERIHILLISGGVVIFGEDSIARCLMAILVSAIWILFLAYNRPYRAQWDNFLAMLLAVELILSLVLGLASEVGGGIGGDQALSLAGTNSTNTTGSAFSVQTNRFEQDAKAFWIQTTYIFVIVIGMTIVIGSIPCIKETVSRWFIHNVARKLSSMVDGAWAYLRDSICAGCSFCKKNCRKNPRNHTMVEPLDSDIKDLEGGEENSRSEGNEDDDSDKYRFYTQEQYDGTLKELEAKHRALEAVLRARHTQEVKVKERESQEVISQMKQQNAATLDRVTQEAVAKERESQQAKRQEYASTLRQEHAATHAQATQEAVAKERTSQLQIRQQLEAEHAAALARLEAEQKKRLAAATALRAAGQDDAETERIIQGNLDPNDLITGNHNGGSDLKESNLGSEEGEEGAYGDDNDRGDEEHGDVEGESGGRAGGSNKSDGMDNQEGTEEFLEGQSHATQEASNPHPKEIAPRKAGH